ncbi:hypothetical protein F2Q69_00031240 [Brassica cretica]|uniref:Uncharacterized protein n=1 Tax=Brassica cretica TaxID=69181 RepID=A0A8S9RZQ4_BRACR|nr:hypothetical protein F2Q69_00031240 [Brassica cretica]
MIKYKKLKREQSRSYSEFAFERYNKVRAWATRAVGEIPRTPYILAPSGNLTFIFPCEPSVNRHAAYGLLVKKSMAGNIKWVRYGLREIASKRPSGTNARSLRSDQASAWARSLRSDRASARARSLRGDIVELMFGRYVATELWLELGRYVATERNERSVAT